MLCPSCHATSPSDHRFCDSCGASLQPACPGCGHANRLEARFCGGCGQTLADDPDRPAAGQNPEGWAGLPPRMAALLSSRFAREGERKQVTVLFADIRGSTELIDALDPEQAMQRLEPALQAMAREVRRYGGTVNRMQGDGVMALFGAPVACEDHAVRGCFAAHAMIAAIAALGDALIEIRVGLHSGPVVVRPIGFDISMEYDAAGSTTHLARRMEQLAEPGSALISAATAALAEGFIQTRPLGPVPIKGVSRPVEVFALTGVAPQSRWQVRAAGQALSAFVGRGTDLRVLLDALRRTLDGRGQVVAISGDAGLGKSRLVHEFLHEVAASGLAAPRTAAMSHDRDTAYHLISGLLRSWLGVDSHDSREAIAHKLAASLATLGHRQPDDLAALRSLLDLPDQGGDWSRLDAAQRRQRIHDAVRGLIFQIALRAPLIMVLEDLQWADLESLSVLDEIVDGLATARLLVVATYRPEHANRWARRGAHALIQLAPLDHQASDALLCSRLGDDPALAPLREKLIARADGTPLFLEEMARTLVETGVLVAEAATDAGPRFRLTRDVAEVEIPQSVLIVLAARLDRLRAAERTLLQVASVIGPDIPVMVLAAVADVPPDRLGRMLADLCQNEFLHVVSSSFGTEYMFKHALTHKVAYDSMLVRQRSSLHGRVLGVIEQQFAARIDEFTERLADHATRAALPDKALAYGLKAGQRANDRSAHTAAKLFFERALGLIDPADTREETLSRAIEIRLGLRVTLAATGDLAQVRQYLDEAEALARHIGDERRLMPIIISRSTILSNLGDVAEAIEAGRRGRGLAEQLADPACLVSSGFALGQAYWNSGDLADAERILTDTVAAFAEPRDKSQSGTTGTASVLCLVSLSHTHSFMGATAQALARARQALDIALRTRRPYDLSYCHAAEGLALLTAGNVQAAIPTLEEAARIARGHDIALLMPHAARYLGRAYALAGRLDEASALLREAIEQATAKSLAPLRGWCEAALGFARLRAGDPGDARVRVASANHFATAHGYRPLQARSARLLGLIASATADTDDGAAARAEAWLRGAVELAGAIGMRPEEADSRRDFADLLLRVGREAEAARELAAAIALYRACDMPAAALAAESVREALRAGAAA